MRKIQVFINVQISSLTDKFKRDTYSPFFKIFVTPLEYLLRYVSSDGDVLRGRIKANFGFYDILPLKTSPSGETYLGKYSRGVTNKKLDYNSYHSVAESKVDSF